MRSRLLLLEVFIGSMASASLAFAAYRLRRRQRLLERIAEGRLHPWRLTPPEGGHVEAALLVGGTVEPALARAHVLLRGAHDHVVGQFQPPPWAGGMAGARRGERLARQVLKHFGLVVAVISTTGLVVIALMTVITSVGLFHRW